MKSNVLEKLAAAPAGSFHVLDAAKAKRMNAKTMYIPSPQDMVVAIRQISHGETMTIAQLRQKIAHQHGAETACPAKINGYWKWLAHASLEPDAPEAWHIPWWRVLKDGKPSRHMPGGVERHLEMLALETTSPSV